jgi:hypothetical protein
MSGAEGNMDIRAPLGALFVLLGAMLAGYGLLASGSGGPSDLSSGTNVNLWWGLVMLAFGALMLALSRRAASRPSRDA